MLTTIILTVILWVLFFLMERAVAAFYPHPFIIEYFPDDVKKARGHKPPFKAAPVIGWVLLALICIGLIGTFIYGGWDGSPKAIPMFSFL